MSPAAGGRTRAAGCGPRRLRRAEGRGSRPWASRRGLGSQRSPLAGGSALVWTAFRGRAFLSGPHSPHRLLCSRSQGAARRVLGAAGGAEARAGWGRGSERVRAANLVFGERDMTNLSEIQIEESAFCRNIQAYPLPQVSNTSGLFHSPVWRSFYLTRGRVVACNSGI